MKEGYLAFDLGASSGRLMLGKIEEGKIILEEIHRFANEPVYLGKTYYWDLLRLFHEIKIGLKKAAKIKDIEIKSIGIDTWGVDGAWLDKDDKLISNPIHYRDLRSKEIQEEFRKRVSEEDLYNITGIQDMSFNTIYQWYYDLNKNDTIKDKARAWLFMPDLFSFLLTGEKKNEYTIATTGAVIDIRKKNYSKELLKKLNIKDNFLQELIEAGNVYGFLSKEVQKEVKLGEIPVIAVASHDTASAVAAIPLTRKNQVYLISGTWSLLGMEKDRPYINKSTLKHKITNEGGVNNKIRLLKNINGLWFLQELKKIWNERGMDLTYADIGQAASKENHSYAIDVFEERFIAPLDMEKEIIDYCMEMYNISLKTIGQVALAAYNGLVNQYKETINYFEKITNEEIDEIKMVGGGIKDEFLCIHIAKSLNRKLITGPVEASALGNIMMQMKALGKISSIEEGREIISLSFEQKSYGGGR